MSKALFRKRFMPELNAKPPAAISKDFDRHRSKSPCWYEQTGWPCTAAGTESPPPHSLQGDYFRKDVANILGRRRTTRYTVFYCKRPILPRGSKNPSVFWSHIQYTLGFVASAAWNGARPCPAGNASPQLLLKSSGGTWKSSWLCCTQRTCASRYLKKKKKDKAARHRSFQNTPTLLPHHTTSGPSNADAHGGFYCSANLSVG